MLNRILAKGPVEHLNRTKKAQMIDAILRGHRRSAFEGKRILDVGCGNGRISRYFIDRGHIVAGVDVADKRKENVPGLEFHLIAGTYLPFDDDSFDVVLSNHVIEHVEDQGEHLKELHRVLRKDGMCYLATPNKSSPIMQGHVGNEMVLRYYQMQPLFEQYGFRVFEYSTRVLTEPDRYNGPFRMGRFLPRWLAYALRSYYPSHHFVLEPID